MHHAYTVSTHFAREVVRAFQRTGYATPDMTSGLPINSIMTARDDRISLDHFCKVLQQMEQHSEDPDIGLVLGQFMEPACFTVLGHLVMASDTVGEALAYVARLQPLVIDCADSECRTGEDTVDFFWNPVISLPVEKPLVDLILSATRHFGIWATGIADPFVSVSFRYPSPQNSLRYESIFGTRGLFSQSVNGFSIPKSWYDRPIKSANHDVKPLIYSKAEQLLKSIQSTDSVIQRLPLVLEKLLPEGTATIEMAAAGMHVSVRTLQRHLQEANTSFSEILQQVRLDKANHLLQHTDLTLTEIAMQMGYREQSSFSSAYKNWAGCPPGQVRRRLATVQSA
ncbi:MAG: AraC family transcriptional regulator ligand-binding domain-containing protein [Ketobacteraceae bacterium]|nr:AraC family transcriptional regulator ligand-binding domain-containing protein [Ketobacteraceae bacterium]